MSDNTVPRSKCIRKEATHVYRRVASYFMEGNVIILTVQRSAMSREIVFKIRRHVVTHNLVYL